MYIFNQIKEKNYTGKNLSVQIISIINYRFKKILKFLFELLSYLQRNFQLVVFVVITSPELHKK